MCVCVGGEGRRGVPHTKQSSAVIKHYSSHQNHSPAIQSSQERIVQHSHLWKCIFLKQGETLPAIKLVILGAHLLSRVLSTDSQALLQFARVYHGEWDPVLFTRPQIEPVEPEWLTSTAPPTTCTSVNL